jgi:hypothetical protein
LRNASRGWIIAGTLRQLLIGLINGAFYAMLSLGLAVIFGCSTSSTSRTARNT